MEVAAAIKGQENIDFKQINMNNPQRTKMGGAKGTTHVSSFNILAKASDKVERILCAERELMEIYG